MSKTHPDQRKLTPWIPGDQAPIRDGLYQRKIFGLIKWAVWRKGVWYVGDGVKSNYQVYDHGYIYTWRGLAHPPST